jgi:hypothetical protein
MAYVFIGWWLMFLLAGGLIFAAGAETKRVTAGRGGIAVTFALPDFQVEILLFHTYVFLVVVLLFHIFVGSTGEVTICTVSWFNAWDITYLELFIFSVF